MALTLAQILALPTQTRPRLIQASDRGGAIYQIEEGAAGSTATPVIPNNNDARAVMGLGNTDPVAFGEVGIGSVGDLRLVRTDAGEVSLLNGDSNLNGRLRIQNLTVSTGVITMGVNTLTVTGASAINQDLRTTASPTWAGVTSTGAINGPSTPNSSIGGVAFGGGTIVASSNIRGGGNGSEVTLGSANDVKMRRLGAGSIQFADASNNNAQITFGGGTSSGPVTITDTSTTSISTDGGISMAAGRRFSVFGRMGMESTAGGSVTFTNQASTAPFSKMHFGTNVTSVQGHTIDLTTPGAFRFRTSNDSDFADVFARNAMLSGSLNLPTTLTAPGTTGAQTINTQTGRVNFAAGALTLVVTNSLVTTSSLVDAWLMTNDSSAKDVTAVTVAAGSFTIRLNAAAAAETAVAFYVVKP